MTYTDSQGLYVALYNAGIRGLSDAQCREVVAGLRGMGFDLDGTRHRAGSTVTHPHYDADSTTRAMMDLAQERYLTDPVLHAQVTLVEQVLTLERGHDHAPSPDKALVRLAATLALVVAQHHSEGV